ncbi:MAG: hypothetical protein Q9187_008932 [Circinaria calcarea]
MGYKLFTNTPFDPRLCSAACDAETAYLAAHPPSDGSKPKACTFFNTYLLLKNGVNEGQYCTMYTQAWGKSYAVNDGQWRGTDHYTISYSFSFFNTSTPGNPICPSDISYLKSSGADFCTSYISYTPPAVTQSVVQTQVATVTAVVTNVVVTTPPVSTTTRTVVQTSNVYPFLSARKRDVNASAADNSDYSIAVETVRLTDPAKASASATGMASGSASGPASDVFSDVASDVASTTTGGVSSDVASGIQRRAIATPASVTSWTPSQISSACSLVATGKTTVTAISTVTGIAVTQTVLQTVISAAPLPVTTVTVTATTTQTRSSYSTCLAGGVGTTARFDDDYFVMTLPFAVGIYGTFSKVVYLSVNGFLSINSKPDISNTNRPLPAYYTTTDPRLFLPDVAIAPFWTDLFVDSKLGHSICCDISGPVGQRSITFSYRVGSYEFAGTTDFVFWFYEYFPNVVYFNYLKVPGGSLGATIGVQKASTRQFLQYAYNQNIVTPNRLLVLDTVSNKITALQ